MTAELYSARTNERVFEIAERAVQGSSHAYVPFPRNGSHQIAPQPFRRFALLDILATLKFRFPNLNIHYLSTKGLASQVFVVFNTIAADS